VGQENPTFPGRSPEHGRIGGRRQANIPDASDIEVRLEAQQAGEDPAIEILVRSQSSQA